MHASLRGNGLSRNTAASSAQCSLSYFGMKAKHRSENKAANRKSGPSTVACSQNKIERCGISGDTAPGLPAARKDFQQRANQAM